MTNPLSSAHLALALGLALLVGCGGSSEPPPTPADPAAPSAPATPSQPVEPAPVAPTPPIPPTPQHPTGRAVYVDNDQPERLVIALGSARLDIGPWQLGVLEPAPGAHVLEGRPVVIDPSSPQLLVYNPKGTGVYEHVEQIYGTSEPSPPRVLERIMGQLLFARRADFGLGKAFPFVVHDEPYRYKLRKRWPEPAGLEQALGVLATPPDLVDDRVSALTDAYAVLENHPADPRVWDLALRDVGEIQAGSFARRVVSKRAELDPAGTRAAIEALPDSGAKRGLMAPFLVAEQAELRRRLEAGEFAAALESPQQAASMSRSIRLKLTSKPFAAPEITAIQSAFEAAAAPDRVALCRLFLERYQGDLSALAQWAAESTERGLADHAYSWFHQAALAGDGAAALGVLEVRAGASVPAARKALAALALGESAPHALRAAKAIADHARQLSEAARPEALEELSRALLHHRGAGAGVKPAATELGKIGAELLAAKNVEARGAGAALIAVAVQHTKERSLVERLRRASVSERDPKLRSELEQRVRYLDTVVER